LEDFATLYMKTNAEAQREIIAGNSNSAFLCLSSVVSLFVWTRAVMVNGNQCRLMQLGAPPLILGGHSDQT
jgi:hypothetical protein